MNWSYVERAGWIATIAAVPVALVAWYWPQSPERAKESQETFSTGNAPSSSASTPSIYPRKLAERATDATSGIRSPPSNAPPGHEQQTATGAQRTALNAPTRQPPLTTRVFGSALEQPSPSPVGPSELSRPQFIGSHILPVPTVEPPAPLQQSQSPDVQGQSPRQSRPALQPLPFVEVDGVKFLPDPHSRSVFATDLRSGRPLREFTYDVFPLGLFACGGRIQMYAVEAKGPSGTILDFGQVLDRHQSSVIAQSYEFDPVTGELSARGVSVPAPPELRIRQFKCGA